MVIKTKTKKEIEMKKLLLSMAVIAFTASSFAANRTWVLSGDSLAKILLANTVKTGGTSTDLNSQTIKFQGGYNAGIYEVGPIFEFTNYDKGTSTKTTYLGAYGRYNFVDNVSGVSIVPFGQLNLKTGTEKTATTESDIFGWSIEGGASFFPFNDVVGINGTLAYRDEKSSTSGTDTTTAGFVLGTAFNLYF